MITQRIDPEDEFKNPNINYNILMGKLKSRILDLEEDFKNVKDPIIKGIINQELIDARKEYFDYIKTDLELQHLVLSNPEIYGVGDEE